MRISLKWLADYVATPGGEELARRLTGAGFEVEAVERTGGQLDGVIVARIVSSEKHPEADKLSVTMVDTGESELLRIVCGAKNYKVGDLVPLAKIGTRLPGGQNIEKAKLRGIESSGMLCSERELGLADDASGLLILSADAKPGTPIAEFLGLEDTFLEVNVAPNRPDALSHVGLAREVAALFGSPLRFPSPKLEEQGEPASDAVKVRIEAPEKCRRYSARVIEGVKIGPSPTWLARRLEQCGVRSISNVVDASNFVLLELGHPLHAFDLDKVAGHEIVVRTASPGEVITTLDGKQRKLDPDDLVIADRDRASALAGIMGGGDSEISDGTTRVLLEAAYFAPSDIRRTARRHGLHTEASHRFERGADLGMVITALDRCAALIAELSGGTVRRGIVDVYPKPTQPAEMRLAWARPAEVLGVDVSRDEVNRILGSLGFEERGASLLGASFRVPSWRVDISTEEDLIEEIARGKGYDAISETLPDISPQTASGSEESEILARVREALEASGFSEAVNFSFVSTGDLEPLGLPPMEGSEKAMLGITVKNPISADLAIMRTSLLPSLLRNVAHNLRQRIVDARLYEIAAVYQPMQGDLAKEMPAAESLCVAGVLIGRRCPVGWGTGSEQVDFYDAKAALEHVMGAARVSEVNWAPEDTPWLHTRSACKITVGPRGDLLGHLGELHPRVAEAFDLPRGVYVFQLFFDVLKRHARLVPGCQRIPRFPAVLRDLAVLVADTVPAGKVVELVGSEGLVERVTLFDVYKGAPIPPGKKNLAMSISYRAADRTLTDGEVDAVHSRIVKRVEAELGADLRG